MDKKLLLALTCINVFEDRRVSDSDSFDIQQLVYLVDLDLLVCNDKKMGKVCQLVYDEQIRCLSLKDFLNEIAGTHTVAVHASTISA